MLKYIDPGIQFARTDINTCPLVLTNSIICQLFCSRSHLPREKAADAAGVRGGATRFSGIFSYLNYPQFSTPTEHLHQTSGAFQQLPFAQAALRSTAAWELGESMAWQRIHESGKISNDQYINNYKHGFPLRKAACAWPWGHTLCISWVGRPISCLEWWYEWSNDGHRMGSCGISISISRKAKM